MKKTQKLIKKILEKFSTSPFDTILQEKQFEDSKVTRIFESVVGNRRL